MSCAEVDFDLSFQRQVRWSKSSWSSKSTYSYAGISSHVDNETFSKVFSIEDARPNRFVDGALTESKERIEELKAIAPEDGIQVSEKSEDLTLVLIKRLCLTERPAITLTERGDFCLGWRGKRRQSLTVYVNSNGTFDLALLLPDGSQAETLNEVDDAVKAINNSRFW